MLKGKLTTIVYLLVITGVIFGLSVGCKKEEDVKAVADYDGNVYKTVRIGSQLWTAENLKTNRFNDGTPIPQVTDSVAWCNLTTAGFCYYENNPKAFQNAFGALYNWYAVNTGNLAPAGWHVATDDDYTVLMKELGEAPRAGGKMKSTGYYGSANGLWYPFNSGASNESGFSGNPAGEREANGTFSGLFSGTCFWSASGNDASKAWYRGLSCMSPGVYRNSIEKSTGFSVRCVKNE